MRLARDSKNAVASTDDKEKRIHKSDSLSPAFSSGRICCCNFKERCDAAAKVYELVDTDLCKLVSVPSWTFAKSHDRVTRYCFYLGIDVGNFRCT
jgi:hypothetical protein